MRVNIIPYLVMAMAFVISDFALASDVQARSRGGQSLRTAPSMKAPRTRAAPRNVVPVYRSWAATCTVRARSITNGTTAL